LAEHVKAAPGSRTLCEQLEQALRLYIPDIESVRHDDTCAFFQPGRNQFAHVYHFMRTNEIKVYFSGDSSSRPIDPCGVLQPQDIRVRSQLRTAWEKGFPFFIMLGDENRVQSAARILHEFAYPLSIKKRRRRQAEQTSPTADFTLPEELPESTSFYEGARKTINVNRYERNSAARAKCIAHHGTICSVCKFDFEAFYGPIGKGYIHVHHIVPLAEIKENYKVDPVNDLRPICPNCHAMVHRNSGTRDWQDIASLVNKCKRLEK